jgi:hypothetical protein
MPKYHGLYRKKGDRFCSEVFFPCETWEFFVVLIAVIDAVI